jgi:hypothetical protein
MTMFGVYQPHQGQKKSSPQLPAIHHLELRSCSQGWPIVALAEIAKPSIALTSAGEN